MKLWIPLVALAACGRAPADARPVATDATVSLAPKTEAAAAPADAGTPAASPPALDKVRPAMDAAAKALVDDEWTTGMVVALIDESGQETFLTYGLAREKGKPV